MTCVVGVQALVFQDGGLLAFGSNIFNVAVIGVLVSYTVYRLFQRPGTGRSWGIFAGGFAAAWASVFLASLAVALQLAVSGTSPANVALPAMGGIHALIGIGEGLITVGALAFLFAARRDLLWAGNAQPARSGSLAWALGLAIALALAVLSPIVSSNPDGLEWVTEQAGFLETAREATFTIIPDYVMPGVSDEALATIIAGVIGTVLVFGIALGVGWSRSRNRAVSSSEGA